MHNTKMTRFQLSLLRPFLHASVLTLETIKRMNEENEFPVIEVWPCDQILGSRVVPQSLKSHAAHLKTLLLTFCFENSRVLFAPEHNPEGSAGSH